MQIDWQLDPALQKEPIGSRLSEQRASVTAELKNISLSGPQRKRLQSTMMMYDAKLPPVGWPCFRQNGMSSCSSKKNEPWYR
jgi:hypothetical protein